MKALRSNWNSNAGYQLGFVTNDVIPRYGEHWAFIGVFEEGKIGFGSMPKDSTPELYLGGSDRRLDRRALLSII